MKPLIHVSGAAGADEAGRGPLAGPVVAAAVILPDGFDLTDVRDSKMLDRDRREQVAARILAGATFAIELRTPEQIDEMNILWASLDAMAVAIARVAPTHAFIDGNRLPRTISCPTEAVVKGDAKYACIAAASILAKTTRDRLMVAYAAEYPDYGFDRHFGYPTPDHLEALRRHGPCPIHRRTFGPVRDLLQPCLTFDV